MAEAVQKTNTPTGDNTNGGSASLRARVAAVQKIVTPLLMAIYEVQGSVGGAGAQTDGTTSPENQNIELLGKLLDNTVTFSQQTAEQLGAGSGNDHDWVRWALASAASQCVAL